MAITVIAPVGPNPAAVTELVWALVRQEQERVGAVHVVLQSQRARRWWDAEVARRAWPWLIEQLGARVPGEVHLHTARLPDGTVPIDAHDPGIVEAMREPLWQAALLALDRADPIVYALCGGRWRASTALTTTVFQLLARAEDDLVDVRVSDPIAEGGTGFFFPEQPGGPLVGRHDGRSFHPADIVVHLPRVAVPRLAPLLGSTPHDRFVDALAASEQRIRAAAAPGQVQVDLADASIRIDGHPLSLRGGQKVLYAGLLDAAARGVLPVSAHDTRFWSDFLEHLDPHPKWPARLGKALEWLRASGAWQRDHPTHDPEHPEGRQALSEQWSKMRARVQELVADLRGGARLVPRPADGAGSGGWTIDCEPGSIRIINKREGD